MPSMTISPDEVAAFAARADALLVNLGTFDAERQRRGRDRDRADAIGRSEPWVLDPVLIDRSPPRADYARATRGAHARRDPAECSRVRGARRRRRRSRLMRRASGTVLALTGAVDLVTDGANARPHSQRPSADGARHRHGLRRRRADCRFARGRTRPPRRRSVSALLIFGDCRRNRGRERERTGQLRRSIPRCAVQSRPRGDPRARKGFRHECRSSSLCACRSGRAAAGTISPICRARSCRAARRSCNCATRPARRLRMIEEARAIKAALAGSFVPLLINDRVDVALAAGADGVHVGWDDMPVADARRLLGREAIIGLSIKTARAGRGSAARTARLCLHRRRVPDLLEGQQGAAGAAGRLCEARGDGACARAATCRSAPLPASTRAMRPSVIAAGADGIAVISALVADARSGAGAAKRLRAIVDDGLRLRGAA